jgi:asparagine synthase (glutamine-hydrolysing)
MCGIWTSVGLAPDEKYLDIIEHRGPDGHGLKVFDIGGKPVVLGHRRLAIIDTSSAGLQPMPFADERYWLTFNGEIYNYRELRVELEGKGVEFHTHSDSEVLVAAYAQWGEACLERFVGMFAFAILDRASRKLFIARDRFGIKPLYFASTQAGVAFASEIKQLLAVPGVSRRGNVARLYDFVSSGMTDHTNETLFADVLQLRGGEKLTLDLESWAPGIRFRRNVGTACRSRGASGWMRRRPQSAFANSSIRPSVCICAPTCRSDHACRAASIVPPS